MSVIRHKQALIRSRVFELQYSLDSPTDVYLEGSKIKYMTMKQTPVATTISNSTASAAHEPLIIYEERNTSAGAAHHHHKHSINTKDKKKSDTTNRTSSMTWPLHTDGTPMRDAYQITMDLVLGWHSGSIVRFRNATVPECWDGWLDKTLNSQGHVAVETNKIFKVLSDTATATVHSSIQSEFKEVASVSQASSPIPTSEQLSSHIVDTEANITERPSLSPSQQDSAHPLSINSPPPLSLNGRHTVLFNGGTYMGDLVNGQCHGVGEMWYNSGETFNGPETRSGHRGVPTRGDGVSVSRNGDTFTGWWYNGMRHGVGSQ
eukprot:gene37373-46112_t